MIDLKAQKPAKRYASALFETIEDKDFERVLSEIDKFLKLLDENSEFKSFIYHPIVKKEDKKEALREIFGEFSSETMNFLFILLDENRIDCLDEIKDCLKKKINDKNNLLEAEVTLAIEADEAIRDMVKSRLENKFQSKVSINFLKDESLIGGMIVKINDTAVDLSIKRKMENFKRK